MLWHSGLEMAFSDFKLLRSWLGVRYDFNFAVLLFHQKLQPYKSPANSWNGIETGEDQQQSNHHTHSKAHHQVPPCRHGDRVGADCCHVVSVIYRWQSKQRGLTHLPCKRDTHTHIHYTVRWLAQQSHCVFIYKHREAKAAITHTPKKKKESSAEEKPHSEK